MTSTALKVAAVFVSCTLTVVALATATSTVTVTTPTLPDEEGEKCLIEPGLPEACAGGLRAYRWQEVALRISCCMLRNLIGVEENGTAFYYPPCCNDVPKLNTALPLDQSQPFFACQNSVAHNRSSFWSDTYTRFYDLSFHKADDHCTKYEQRYAANRTESQLREQSSQLAAQSSQLADVSSLLVVVRGQLDATREQLKVQSTAIADNTAAVKVVSASVADVQSFVTNVSKALTEQLEAQALASTTFLQWSLANPGRVGIYIAGFFLSLALCYFAAEQLTRNVPSPLTYLVNTASLALVVVTITHITPNSFDLGGVLMMVCPFGACAFGELNPVMCSIAGTLAAIMHSYPKLFAPVVDNIFGHAGNEEGFVAEAMRVSIEELYRLTGKMQPPYTDAMSVRLPPKDAMELRALGGLKHRPAMAAPLDRQWDKEWIARHIDGVATGLFSRVKATLRGVVVGLLSGAKAAFCVAFGFVLHKVGVILSPIARKLGDFATTGVAVAIVVGIAWLFGKSWFCSQSLFSFVC
jgi:hypothetical protein